MPSEGRALFGDGQGECRWAAFHLPHGRLVVVSAAPFMAQRELRLPRPVAWRLKTLEALNLSGAGFLYGDPRGAR